jgi:protein ImuB
METDPDADRAALETLAAWCGRYTPLAAANPLDGLWLDTTGCAHLFRNEAGLAADLAGRLTRNGIPCQLAIAGTSGAAWALARSVSAEKTSVIVPPGEERAALKPLPVACLRLAEPIVVGLRRFGLKTVGDLLHLPRTELTVRFGASVLLRLDQALGAAEEVIVWQRPPQPWESRLAFVEPVATPEDLARMLALLSERLCQRLAEKQLGGHRFVGRFYRVDDAVPQIEIATALPVCDAAYVAKLLGAKLETVDPGFGIETAALVAEEIAPSCPAQNGLLGPNTDASGRLATLVDMLGNRLAPERLWGMVPQESHVPERAVARVPPLAQRRSAWTADPSRPRPVRLLRRPEPIEVIALVPDEPPLSFRWRGALHRVRAASGPERIAVEWWRRTPSSASLGARPETDLVRDYYRVEDVVGSRFWVFRAGLRGGGRWFLHGMFG